MSQVMRKPVLAICEQQRRKSACASTFVVCFQDSIIPLNSVSSQCARGKSSLAWNPEVHPKYLYGKKLLKNVTLQILNFILIIIKIFPVWCNVNFVSVFTAVNNTKKQRKFNITPYGELFYQLTYWDKIYNREVTFLKFFFTTFGMVFRFSYNRLFIKCAMRWDRV